MEPDPRYTYVPSNESRKSYAYSPGESSSLANAPRTTANTTSRTSSYINTSDVSPYDPYWQQGHHHHQSFQNVPSHSNSHYHNQTLHPSPLSQQHPYPQTNEQTAASANSNTVTTGVGSKQPPPGQSASASNATSHRPSQASGSSLRNAVPSSSSSSIPLQKPVTDYSKLQMVCERLMNEADAFAQDPSDSPPIEQLEGWLAMLNETAQFYEFTTSETRSEREQKCTCCGSTTTPEWRRGPYGPRTLCNACGLVYNKLQKKRNNPQAPGGSSDDGDNTEDPRNYSGALPASSTQ